MSSLYEPLPAGHTRVAGIRREVSGELLIMILPCRLVDNTPDGTWSDGRSFVYDDEVSYLALSYTWEDALDTIPLQVSDTQFRKHEIQVTRSLLSAVQRFMELSEDEDCYLWADQLSIDQSSVAEKTQQINMMRQIYEHALYVTVWLGPSRDESLLAFEKIHQVATLYYDALPPLEEPMTLNTLQSTLINNFMGLIWNDGPESRAQWSAVISLLSRPWWSRLWIRAEATALSTDDTFVLCGPSMTSMEQFFRFLSVLNRLEGSPMELCPGLPANMLSNLANLKRFYQARRSSESSTSLLDLVWANQSSKCTDPRDKIFCLVPFASDVSEPGLEFKIDYSQETAVIYTNFAIWSTRRYKHLAILSYCHGIPNENLLLRSWTPDWSRAMQHIPIDFHDAESGNFYEASGGYVKSHDVGPHDPSCPPELLLLDGVRIATVARVSQIAPGRDDLKFLRSWLEPGDRQTICPLSGVTMEQVYAKTITAYRSSPIDIWSDEPLSVSDWVSIRLVTDNRCLFFTKPGSGGDQGLMGIGPSGMRAGDDVFMLKGGRVLYVLRERELRHNADVFCLDLTGGSETAVALSEEDNACLYRGECFIDGLMHGEVLDYMGEEPKRERPPVLDTMDTAFRRVNLV